MLLFSTITQGLVDAVTTLFRNESEHISGNIEMLMWFQALKKNISFLFTLFSNILVNTLFFLIHYILH